MVSSVGGREWRGSEVNAFEVPVIFGVTDLPCFASLAGCSGFTCIMQLGTATSSYPWGWTLCDGRPETSSRAAPGGCSEAGTNILALTVGLGCPAAGKGRGAMEEHVQEWHPQCMNKQLWMGLPDWARLPAAMGIALDSHRAVPICTDPAGMEGWTGVAGRMGEDRVARTG